MIVLDTDVLSELMRDQPSSAVMARLAKLPAEEQATTAITVGEIAYSARLLYRPELYEQVMALLSEIRILPFDERAAEHYGQVRSEIKYQGTTLSDPDLRIASIVLAHAGTLITGGRHFEGVPGLRIDNWAQD